MGYHEREGEGWVEGGREEGGREEGEGWISTNAEYLNYSSYHLVRVITTIHWQWLVRVEDGWWEYGLFKLRR